MTLQRSSLCAYFRETAVRFGVRCDDGGAGYSFQSSALDECGWIEARENGGATEKSIIL